MLEAARWREGIEKKDRKQHRTPGFFCDSVRSAAEAAHAKAGEEIAQPARRDWGRFADVGRHTACIPPTTCWALVVAALQSVMAITEHADLYTFLLTFRVAQAESLCAAATCAAAAPGGKADVRAALDVAHCVCRAAVGAANSVLAAGGDPAAIVQSQLQPRIRTCCRQLAESLAHCQQRELQSASLPNAVSVSEELARSAEITVSPPQQPPRPQPPSTDQRDAALAALQPLTKPPPAGGGATAAAATQRWLAGLPAVGASAPASTRYAALAEAERALHKEALRLLPNGSAPVLHTVDDVKALSALCTATRRRLRAAAAASGAHPHLLVEYRSREALCVWIALCIVHRCAVASWPDLLSFSLPVNPDSVRLLTLSVPRAQRAALAVGAYLAAHGGTVQQVCTTAPSNATMRMAARYVATGPSEALRATAIDEARLAQSREDEFWAVVHAKQTKLQVLDRELLDAETKLARAVDARAEAFQSLSRAQKSEEATYQQLFQAYQSAKLRAGLRKYDEGPACQALPEHAKMLTARAAAQRIAEDVSHALVLHSTSVTCSITDLRSDESGSWRLCHNTVTECEAARDALKREVAETEQPPPPLFHPFPSSLRATQEFFAALFWLHPEHTGFMPYFASYCFEATQVVLPGGETWDTKALHLHSELLSWREYHNRNQVDCSYLPRPGRGVTTGLAADCAFVQLCSTKKPASKRQVNRDCNTVRAFSREAGHGVWYPGLDLQLSWQGGLLPRGDLPQVAFSPFPRPSDRAAVAAAALLHFTEPGRMRDWLLAPMVGPSRLSTTSATFPPFEEASDTDDKTRGAAVVACQAQRPACLTVEQWCAYGAVRAHPRLQMQRLCAALRDGVLYEALSEPEVSTLVRLVVHQVGQLEFDQAAVPFEQGARQLIVAPPNATARILQACQRAHNGRALLTSAALEDADQGAVLPFAEASGDLCAPLVKPVRRRWLQEEHLGVLCTELLAMHATMKPNPKNASKTPVLCELAAFVAARTTRGVAAAEAYARMAAGWADQLRDELHELRSMPARDGLEGGNTASKSDVLQRACAFASALVVIALSFVPARHTDMLTADSALTPAGALWASDLAQHIVLARYQHLPSGNATDTRARQYDGVRESALAVAAEMAPCWAALVAACPHLLTIAAQAVYSSAPDDLEWQAHEASHACFYARTPTKVRTGIDLYSINLLTGAVLRNGVPPSCLPVAMVDHSDYGPLFGGLEFGVTDDLITRHPIRGRFYRFQLVGERLIVFEMRTKIGDGEVLELLPGNCEWCPILPPRLKQLYSHWICRAEHVVLFRGRAYHDRTIRYIMRLGASESGTGYAGEILEVPARLGKLGTHLTAGEMLAESGAMSSMLRYPDNEHGSAPLDALSRIEARAFIHVLSASVVAAEPAQTHGGHRIDSRLSYNVVRLNLTFALRGEQLQSLDHRGYRLGTARDIVGDDGGLPIPVPPFLAAFVVLVPDSRLAHTMLLVPDGHISWDTTVHRVQITPHSSGPAAKLQHHVFSLHPHTGHLRAPTKEARLFLAALYAAGGCAVAIPGLGKTGGQVALDLLRQCAGCTPLSAAEQCNLSALYRHAAHTPALQLLCAHTCKAAQAVAFLWAAPAPQQPIPWHAGHESYYLSSRAAASLSSGLLPALSNPHAELTPSECAIVLSNAQRFQHGPQRSLPRTLKWAAAGAAAAIADLPRVRAEVARLAAILATPVATDAGPRERQIPFEERRIRESPMGCELLDDLLSSLQAHDVAAASAPVATRAPERAIIVASGLESLLHQVQRRRRELSEALLAGMASAPAAARGVAFALLRSSGDIATPTAADLVMLAAEPGRVRTFNPFLSDNAESQVVSCAQDWQELCVWQDKLQRCLKCCPGQPLGEADARFDTTTSQLLAELRNVRSWARAHYPLWLAFEVLEQLEIRERQYSVAAALLANLRKSGDGGAEAHTGAIIQLNMGEGKTRVILPMLVLALAGLQPGSKQQVVRLNFLDALLRDATGYLHNALTGSPLNVPLFEMPFSRDVKLDIYAVRCMLRAVAHCRLAGGFFCVAREHRQSLLLKLQELFVGPPKVSAALSRLVALPFLDILDESDALLSCKQQLVYAWGDHQPLPDAMVRWQVPMELLHVLATDADVQALIADPHVANVVRHKRRFGGMNDTRLVRGERFEEVRPALLAALATGLFRQQPRSKAFYWCHALSQSADSADRLAYLIDAVVSSDAPFRAAVDELGGGFGPDGSMSAHKAQLLCLRGLLSCGVFVHCLMMRHRVDYGRNFRPDAKTRMAVPYEACDLPSQRSEYKHPDAAIVLTVLAYYQEGLSEDALRDVVRRLSTLPDGTRNAKYQAMWALGRADASDQDTNTLHLVDIDHFDKVDADNAVQFELLYRFMRYNRLAVDFWLGMFVLPDETKQFPENLKATAWHVADGTVCGFSGTSDNRQLLPFSVKPEWPEDAATQGTDGKMVILLTTAGKCKFMRLADVARATLGTLRRHSLGTAATATDGLHLDAQAQAGAHGARNGIAAPPAGSNASDAAAPAYHGSQLLDAVVLLGVHALIDAGALLAGLEQDVVASLLIARFSALEGAQGPSESGAAAAALPRFHGVVFYGRDGWQVMDRRGHVQAKATSPIREHEAFVVFDEARCRGADMKLLRNAEAALTLGPRTPRDKLMQAAGRLRQLDKEQKLVLLGTDEVCRLVAGCCGVSERDVAVAHVVEWVHKNTATQNSEILPEFLAQGTHFACGTGHAVFPEREVHGLADMYEHHDANVTLSDVVRKEVEGEEDMPTSAKSLLQRLRTYGRRYCGGRPLPAAGAVEQCERELDIQKEEDQNVEACKEDRTPVAETDWPDWAAASRMASACDAQRVIKARTLKEAAALLDAKDSTRAIGRSFGVLQWPATVWATPNFLFATDQRRALSGCMRLPTHFLLFRDGSALLLSERESEHVFEALSAAEASSAPKASSGTRSAPPCLANLAFARDVLPGVETELHVPLLLGAPSPDVVWRKAAQSVAALQVFAGETGYRRGDSRGYRLTSNEQDSLRVRLVGEIVLGHGPPAGVTRRRGVPLPADCILTSERRDVAKALVESRHRGHLWEDSCLDRYLEEQICLKGSEEARA